MGRPGERRGARVEGWERETSRLTINNRQQYRAPPHKNNDPSAANSRLFFFSPSSDNYLYHL